MEQFICITALILMIFAVSCIRKTVHSSSFTVYTDISSPGNIILLQFYDSKEAERGSHLLNEFSPQ